MHTRIALSALFLAATFAGSAFAETPNAVPEPAFVSTQSRAQVLADLHAYKQAGVNPWATSYNPLRSFQGAATRDAVVADYLASREEVQALTGEDSGSAYLAQARTPGVPANLLAGAPRRAQ